MEVETIKTGRDCIRVIKNFGGQRYCYVLELPTSDLCVVRSHTIAGQQFIEIGGKYTFKSVEEINEALKNSEA